MALAAIAFAAGGCNVSGITFDDPGITGRYRFICAGVTPTVARIRVEPSQVNLRLGSQVLIGATPLDTLGEFVFCARAIEWSSASPSIATVSAGLVVGVSAGKTYIRASSGGKIDSAEVNVVATTMVSGGLRFAFIGVADNSTCAVTVSGETYCLGEERLRSAWRRDEGPPLGRDAKDSSLRSE